MRIDHKERRRILISGAGMKHSLAIQRSLRRAFPSDYLVAHDDSPRTLAGIYGHCDELVRKRTFAQTLEEREWDMVVPVGGAEVRTVAKICPGKALLPKPESLNSAFDKYLTVLLANRLGVPAPRSWLIAGDIRGLDDVTTFPCVVKSVDETTGKFVHYCADRNDLGRAFEAVRHTHPRAFERGILVQEFVHGNGAGFFGLFRNGVCLRYFMHRRLREYPVKGGASTAASAYYHPALHDYGIRLLSALAWDGVAMVEFKHNPVDDSFSLIEINPKFWGSLDLAIHAGVDFPADLVRTYFDLPLPGNGEYRRDARFYWPLEGDLLHLWETGRVKGLCDYFRKGAQTDLFHSLPADCVRLGSFLRKAMRHSWRNGIGALRAIGQ